MRELLERFAFPCIFPCLRPLIRNSARALLRLTASRGGSPRNPAIAGPNYFAVACEGYPRGHFFFQTQIRHYWLPFQEGLRAGGISDEPAGIARSRTFDSSPNR